ncbi:disease resistance protein RPV1-like [Diospyros lotus]|uniref:disease resistance protein RPV1-like n=1 Tax=Diospyros lotus TaxID=55363 RepID=UPI0022575860|nr:disease resistance protein RPV1-like [Diospyros lotus]
MGGLGKTTLAGAVFSQIFCRFDGGCCFVANVREESENCGGLVHLRDKLLCQILGQKLNLGTSHITPFIKRRLQSKKVFIVLDDVNSLKQLETLVGGLDRFGPGSRVLITARDKQLLLKFVVPNNIYEVKPLDGHEALQLFCNYAFKVDPIPKDLMVYAQRATNYAKGNPLALKVLGSSLYRNSEQDWESALHKLNKISKPKIHNILRIGYDAPDRKDKNILLYIGYFFEEEYRDHVIEILNSCYFSVEAGLSVLIDKSLIEILASEIKMHDLLQEMCWEIVRQESLNKPGERSRLHVHEDVCRVLRTNTVSVSMFGFVS